MTIFWVTGSKWALMEWGCCRQGLPGVPGPCEGSQHWHCPDSVAAFQSALEPQTFTEHSAQSGELVSWGLFSLWEKTWLDGETNKDFNIFSQCITHIFQLPGWGLYF